MTEPMLVDVLTFSGLMAVLAATTTVVVTFIKRGPRQAKRSDGELTQIAAQLEALRETVESTAIEVERIGEAQRFTTRLLTELPRLNEAPRLSSKVNTPH